MPTTSIYLHAFVVLWTSLLHWANGATSQQVTDCPGYKASNVKTFDGGLTADLTLAGEACNIYGKDLHDLKLKAEYQTGSFFLTTTDTGWGRAFQINDSGTKPMFPLAAQVAMSPSFVLSYEKWALVSGELGDSFFKCLQRSS
jgi:hypothetical protein